MDVSILVPLSSGRQRETLWRWLRHRYEQDLPDWEIVVGTAPEHEWSKGRAVASAAQRADGDVFVLADADSWVAAGVLQAAVGCVEAGDPWVVPHGTVYRLSELRTAGVLAGTTTPERQLAGCKWVHAAVVGGGISVMPRQAYDMVGGIDERFTGWGGEDIALGWALDTLVGEHVSLGAPLVHLWHPFAPNRRKSNNPAVEKLAGRYLDANGDPVAMRALIEEAGSGN